MQVAVVALVLRRHFAAPWRLVIMAVAAVLAWQSPWCLAARADSTETLLVLVATALGLEAARAADRGARATAWLAAGLVCGSLAVLTKQSAVVAGLILLPPAPVLLGWRRTALACAAAAAPSVLLAAALILPFGPAPKANLIDWVTNGTSPAAAIAMTYAPYLKSMAAPVAGAVLASLALLAGRRDDPRGRAEILVGWATLAALAVAVRLALNYGSAVNYFNVSNLIIILAVAAVLARRAMAGARGPRAFAALYLALALPAKIYENLNSFIARSPPYSGAAEVARRLAPLLDAAPGSRFFSEDPRLDCLLPDRSALPQKLSMCMLELRRPGFFTHFADEVRDGTIRYCVTFDEHPTDLADSLRQFSRANAARPDPERAAFQGASFEGFHLLFRIGPHAVYETPQKGNRTGSSDIGRRSP
jgi:hypothetical protein